MNELKAAGIKLGVASSSKNCKPVLKGLICLKFLMPALMALFRLNWVYTVNPNPIFLPQPAILLV
jgi:hypothetical protein